MDPRRPRRLSAALVFERGITHGGNDESVKPSAALQRVIIRPTGCTARGGWACQARLGGGVQKLYLRRTKWGDGLDAPDRDAVFENQAVKPAAPPKPWPQAHEQAAAVVTRPDAGAVLRV